MAKVHQIEAAVHVNSQFSISGGLFGIGMLSVSDRRRRRVTGFRLFLFSATEMKEL